MKNKKELILLNDAKEIVKNYGKQAIDVGLKNLDVVDGIVDIVRLIEKIPTIDAVEVVRCKDCKHRGNDDICPMIKIRMCNDGDGYFDEVSEDKTFDDGFCSYGERKAE